MHRALRPPNSTFKGRRAKRARLTRALGSPTMPFKNSGLKVVALVMAVYVVGCASSGPKMESASVAKRLGVSGCKVSVPMSEKEVLVSARDWGDPHLETRNEWTELLAASRAGDELRLVDCIKPDKDGVAFGYYYYALFRNQTIVAKIPGAIIN